LTNAHSTRRIWESEENCDFLSLPEKKIGKKKESEKKLAGGGDGGEKKRLQRSKTVSNEIQTAVC
jgi:hypothetical protein